jgi:hypothetical protein
MFARRNFFGLLVLVPLQRFIPLHQQVKSEQPHWCTRAPSASHRLWSPCSNVSLHASSQSCRVLQILVPLVATSVVLLLAAIIAAWTSASGAVVICTILPSVGLMGITTALLQGGLFSLAGLCPPIYVQVSRVCHHYTPFCIPRDDYSVLKSSPGPAS